MASDQDPEFETLLQFLKDSRGFDFTGYKRTSLMRRVDRRMQQVEISSYADYLDYLQLHQEEFTALFNTILINVTAFFRDTDAWMHLRDDALPNMLSARKPSDPIRVWSAGCASGEEAYSAAIILAELMGPDDFRDRVKIYATDVDEEALGQARQAGYLESAIKGVPEELRDAYFEKQGQRYVFRNDLRRSVIFGRNDLVQDAPISRVDFLLCRNTLMYFNAETQAKIVNRFHLAMNEDAVLFLGKAEMLLSHGELFQPVDLKRRFFRKVPRPNGNGVRLLTGNGYADTSADPAGLASLRAEGLVTSPVATLLVSNDGLLAFSNQRAEALFGLSARDIGRPFRDLEVSYRPIELRAYIDQVRSERRPTWIREVEAHRGPTETTYLDIQIAPVSTGDGGNVGVAIYFSDVTRYRNLQSELELTNRQLETAYEELQSTVEELETMNEELQSTNDELQTINDELRDRTQEVNDANPRGDDPG